MAEKYSFRKGAPSKYRLGITLFLLILTLYLFTEIQSAPSPTGEAISGGKNLGFLKKAPIEPSETQNSTNASGFVEPAAPAAGNATKSGQTILGSLLGFLGGGSGGGSSNSGGAQAPETPQEPEPLAPKIIVKANTRDLPAEFWGTAVTNSGNPAAGGLKAEAKINGVLFSETSTVRDSSSGQTYYDIIIPADDPNTAEKEGGVSGDKINIYVGGKSTSPELAWTAGIRQANLNIQ